MGFISAEMPLSRIRDLEYDDDIAYISPDRRIASHGHVEQTIGAGATNSGYKLRAVYDTIFLA